MNRLLKEIYVFLLAGILFVACYEDKGNYDYRTINEVTITGIHEKYEAIRWETFSIKDFTINDDGNPHKYLYEWWLDTIKVSDQKELNYEVAVKEGKYTGRFIVIDTEIDSIRFFSTFELQVFNTFSKGIMLLSQLENEPILSFIRDDQNSVGDHVIHKVFQKENRGEKMAGKALGLEQPSMYYYFGEVMVHTTDASYKLHPEKLYYVKKYDKNSFMESGEEYKASFVRFIGETEEYGVVLNKKDGKIYPKYYDSDYFGLPSPRPAHTIEGEPVDYELAPFILAGRRRALGYDNLSGKFIYFEPDYLGVDMYQLNQVTLSRTYIGLPFLSCNLNSSKSSLSYTSLFLKPETGEAKMALHHNSSGGLRGPDSLRTIENHHLNENTKVEINPGTDILYYSSGNTIYQMNVGWNEQDLTSKLFVTIDGAERISMIKLSNDWQSLWVGVTVKRDDEMVGDVYQIGLKRGEVLRHISRFGGVPVEIIEKLPVLEYQ